MSTQRCQHPTCTNAATLYVRIPSEGIDSRTQFVCDEHWLWARAEGAEPEEWLDRPKYLDGAA